ncbi:hypothetical protein [Wolbachia endosymbiont of Folsomia candida]|uniref:hypothetical protein n=1 Tax=Wolbachia endosymbiont of Folsomia candida TaxID=169402 RepID=UPI001300A4DC|nr:hypothetical protein [Wolbachia endosymbiont of Folsomia candida]
MNCKKLLPHVQKSHYSGNRERLFELKFIHSLVSLQCTPYFHPSSPKVVIPVGSKGVIRLCCIATQRFEIINKTFPFFVIRVADTGI